MLKRIPYDRVAWDAIVASHEDAEVYHTAAWLEFLAASQGAEPVIAVVSIDGRPVGYFVGAIVRRLGVRVLGSPLRGWGTQCMGFLLDDGVDRRAVADALIPFAFHDLGCLHVELADRKLSKEQMEGSKYAVELGTSYSIDLTKSEDALLQAMQPKTRQKIRKALRGQLRVDDTTDAAFADEFHAFLTETFARQGIGPTYDVGRVRQLIESLHGTGLLLLLRVRSPEGKVLAAGISVGGRRVAVSWGLSDGSIRRRPEPGAVAVVGDHPTLARPPSVVLRHGRRRRVQGEVRPGRRLSRLTSSGLDGPSSRSAGRPCAGSHIRAKSSRAPEAAVAPARRLVRNERCGELTRNVDPHSLRAGWVLSIATQAVSRVGWRRRQRGA